MLGPSATPTTNMLPQSDIAQYERRTPSPRTRIPKDPNNRRPDCIRNSLQVWAAEPRRPHKVSTNMYTEVAAKHWKNFCAVMDTWIDDSEDIVASFAIEADLRVA